MTSQHKKFCDSLTSDEKMLIVLRDELYDGSWDKMIQDLKDRLKGKPYIFKLVNRIQDDVVRIEKLRDYEQKNNINLSEYIKGNSNG